VDALSEILRMVHLSGAIFVHGRYAAPWRFQSPCTALSARWLEICAERVVIFHLITEGECTVEVEGMPPLHARAGDVVMLMHGQAHRVASDPGLGSEQGANVKKLPPWGSRPETGAGERPTHIVCGYMACDYRLGQMLLNGAPPMIKVNVHESGTGEWLESSVRHALAEVSSPRSGSASMLSKLAEVLFIEVLRLYAHQSDNRVGWLAGLGDRIVGRALNLLHERPAHDWTLDELARVSGTSRSVLAERFQQLVGTSPMQYLAQWRLMMAANLLCRSNAPLANIAEEVGYQTDTSFIRAFRREYGLPPAAWRRNRSRQRKRSADSA
jgi:AraC-like DNA-binding protein